MPNDSSIRAITLALCILLFGTKTHAQLVINELMQSNIDCIMDDLNEFPDSWVELFNTDTIAVNLNDYKLGKDDSEAKAWRLPNLTIDPKHHVVVYCDKGKTGMHTDFRLESGKGSAVYLFKGDSVIDRVTGLRQQPAPNIAYGRETDGDDSWGYQAEPTPGYTNCGKTVKEILGDPVFSEQGCIFTVPGNHTLTLSLPEGTPDGAEIHYTTNGSEPTIASKTYTSPITFSDNLTVRAKIFHDGYMSPPSTVHSYIFFTQRQLTLPVVSIVTDDRYLNDSIIGIYVKGSYQNGKNNYSFNWRRPINFEYFENGDETSMLNQLCEARIMGNASREYAMKSLVVYANKRFGTKRLEYEFFPDQRPGISDFKSIALRNAGNDFDFLYMRDAIIQRSMAEHADLDWQSWRPVIVYMNGTYKGMLNIRDRANEDYIYTYYDGLEDIDMIENWWDLKAGDWDHFNTFKEFYTEHGHTLSEYEQWMDCTEFANLMIMNLYYSNQDFPGSNIVIWRPRREDGRWRFIAKDTDFGLGLYDHPVTYKTIEWLYDPDYDSYRNWGNQYEYTRLFRRLMEDQGFFNLFIDRSAVYMGDFLNERGVRPVWDPMYELIRYEYPNHRELYDALWPDYNEELENARIWLRQRTDIFYQQLADFYHLGNPSPLTINKDATNDLEDIKFTFNDIPLSEGMFDGKYFSGRPIRLNATSANGMEVTGWDITTETADGDATRIHMDGAALSFTMPPDRTVTVKAVVGTNSLEGVRSKEKGVRRQGVQGVQGQYYRLDGIPLAHPHRGINVVRKQGKVLY